MKKKIFICLLCLLGLIIGNGTYWVFSDVQQRCYQKVKKANYAPNALNLYEKCSIYSMNLAICLFGFPISPEATKQQIYTLFPTNGIQEWYSTALFKNKKIQDLMKEYPKATSNNPVYIAWKAGYNDFGLYSPYNFENMRASLACNGCYLYKEKDKWIITPKEHKFIYPNLHFPTYIGPFKVHEGLIYYLQKTGWLFVPRYKWILD
jgi:hypothetical protein